MEDAQSPRWLGELTMPPVSTWQSVRHAHTILQRRGGVGGDTQLELCRPGVGLGPLVRRPQDSPGAANRFVDFDANRAGLVVADRDLVLDLVDVGGDLLE